MPLWLLLLIIAAALCVLLYIKDGRSQGNAPPIYREWPYIPLLGSVWQFATCPREFLNRGHDKLGEIFTVNLFGSKMTFLMGSEGHELFFKTPDEIFDIREAYKCTAVTFGPGVCYDCPAKITYQQFGFFKTCLDSERFRYYVPIIEQEVAEYFSSKWGESGEKCLFTALSECFTLTSAHCLLGEEIRANWNGEFATYYRDLDHSFIPITFFFPNLPNPYRQKCVKARQHFEKMFTKVVERRRENNEKHEDFLQYLIEARYKEGNALTMSEITGIMVGVLLGGQHTSNVTGTWMISHLLHSDKWKRAIMEEQREVLDGTLTRPLELEDLEKMKVFDQVLDETLRLHPPFFQLARVSTQDMEFKGHVIPKGHFVAISPGGAGRMRELWGDDAEEFNPERFTPENIKKHPKYAWIPFGGGRHICSGRKFAVSSLKIALTWLLKNYKLEMAAPMPKDDYTTMVVAPQAPVLIKYERINHA